MKCAGIRIVGYEALYPSTRDTSGACALKAADGRSLASWELVASDLPGDMEYRVAQPDVTGVLGTKGVRTIDRTAALTLCTSQPVMARLAVRERVPSERIGCVIGTSTGSIRSTSDFVRESFVRERPYMVSVAQFPNSMMNYAAGQCGIRFHAHGVNATVSGGRLSGLLAFRYASQMLRRGYVDLLLVGSTEELCPQAAWAHRQLVHHGRRRLVPLGEGCAMFALARSGEEKTLAQGVPVADVAALQYGRYFNGPLATQDEALTGINACIEQALAQAGISADRVRNCVLCGAADAAIGELEQRVAMQVFGHNARIEGGKFVERFGDTYSATSSLALAWVLEQASDAPSYGVVLATSHDGHVGCLIVQRHVAWF